MFEPLNTINVLKNFDGIINKYSLSLRTIKEMHKELFKNTSFDSMKSEIGVFKRKTNILKDNITGEIIFIPAEVDILKRMK